MSIEKLKKLEQEGKHVFHGSPNGSIKSLEPRQGRHVPDWSKPDETTLDGNPAVSATPYAELATFRALINRENVSINHTSGFGIRDGNAEFRVSSEDVLKEVKDKKGFVYVFDKNNFEPYKRDQVATTDSMEWRSYEEVEPSDVIEVTSKDMPSSDRIKIVE
ncbi:MAG: hypothetical protein WC087_03015 [Candidatus Paceibacterota bacterium]